MLMRHALPGTHCVDRDRKRTDLSVYGWFFDQESLSTTRRLHLAIGQLSNLEFRRHRLANADQLAGVVERLNEVGERREGHLRVTERDRPMAALGPGAMAGYVARHTTRCELPAGSASRRAL